MAFEIRGVSAGYDGSKVLNAVSLTVGEGAIVALLGANGSGKTTTLRVASRMIDVDAGQVLLDGADITRLRPDKAARAGICHVPEGRGIFPGLTVRDNLLIFEGKRDPKTALDRAAAVFPRLGDLADRIAGTLSGGEQQMVALSRAYLSQPKIALLDEISMGLAPLVVQELYAALPKLTEAGCSLLVVEQYVGQALALADYVYILAKGQVVREGTAADIAREGNLAETYFEGVTT
ncbi:MAG TPA: ABC transporter ATP-binding protein [Acidimicrobiales bacterium]|nr:ABC transporter ATP-binding protein [Acidimicrobiales bacterium]